MQTGGHVSTENKYVLCCPMGGFNDNLCQLSRCITYCIKYKRTLVLSSRWGRLFDWSLGLIWREDSQEEPRTIQLSHENFEWLSKLKCYPYNLKESDFSYSFIEEDGAKKIRSNNSAILITFEFDKDYEEPVLVHQSSGGGGLSQKAIPYFKVTANLADRLAAFKQSNAGYVAVHIRNTDYVSDYRSFLLEISETYKDNKILVCSDDFYVKKEAKELFGGRFISAIDIPEAKHKGLGLHYNGHNTSKFIVESTVLELCLLANSTEFVKCPLKGHSNKSVSLGSVKYSGFALLAEYLHKNKNILNSFIQ